MNSIICSIELLGEAVRATQDGGSGRDEVGHSKRVEDLLGKFVPWRRGTEERRMPWVCHGSVCPCGVWVSARRAVVRRRLINPSRLNDDEAVAVLEVVEPGQHEQGDLQRPL